MYYDMMLRVHGERAKQEAIEAARSRRKALPMMEGLQLWQPTNLKLTICWSKALKMVANGFSEMKEWRQLPQRPSSFA